MTGGGTVARGFLTSLGVVFLSLLWDMGGLVRLQWYVQSEVSVLSNQGTDFTGCSFKNPPLQGFSHPPTHVEHHRCGQNHCCPNGFYEELQVLRCESQSCHSIDILDILSAWSSADLCNVAWFATVESKTAMRVFLHWFRAVQVNRLGGCGCCGSGRFVQGRG